MKRLKKANTVVNIDNVANDVFKRNKNEIINDINRVLSKVSDSCLEEIKTTEDILYSPNELWDDGPNGFGFECNNICEQDIFDILSEQYNYNLDKEDYLFDDTYISICQKISEKVYKLARAIALNS